MNSAETPAAQSAGMGRAASWLIASDVLLQGSRYAFILYVGFCSIPMLGSFLFGTSLGALLAVFVDFGINQHWLRLPAMDLVFSKSTFLRVFTGKTAISALSVGVLVTLAGTGVVRMAPMPAMVIGVLLAALQGLIETCEAIALACRRYRTLSFFRIVISVAVYVLPLAVGWMSTAEISEAGLLRALYSAFIASVVVLGFYGWYIATSLPSRSDDTAGYRHAWWQARWLGLNQAAIVVDVRAPLVILGLMLGEAAVGLYGLVQRTTAVVELAWASISKLLLQSYAGSAVTNAAKDVRRGMRTTVKRTLVIMAVLTGLIWIISWYAEQEMRLSHESSVGLSLLRWGLVAMTLSSLKRPFIAGLLAFHQERAVCRINLYSAAAGLVLVPLLILWLGIWGPVVGWIVLEAAACLLLFHYARSVSYASPSDFGGSVPQRAGA